ncbi:TPA: RimK family protein [Pseudomonas aeruginosa]|uniref:RimK family protein n=1 Tax=Pseudomonas aeruginosa TaxID=287 RepID=UPI000423638E|nr:RimK family protein [Pseudomonas aeruginosa]MBA4928292.1 RimK family protein [Pseudomonas aeruginosa]MBY5274735.1 RimK family protein [Pseudomonas aeruginosa]MCO3493867.1 ATP-grasp domain-containing protein [Pseudomonas aeruginosa]MCO3516896.1 ATP-grasp domain-containing protein [Pseudomonas aeruginosa]MCO3870741.1 ATP-grasp domain-containing protein [Pseudomonas aeruginosa]
MSKLFIIVERKEDWTSYYPSEDVVTAQEYLELPIDDDTGKRVQVINLCRHYKYLRHGYYCSLLAEARGHKVIPSVRTISELARKSLYSLVLEDLDRTLYKALAAHPYGSTDGFTLTLYFGRTDIEPLQDLARQLFEAFPCPLLLVEFKRNRTWHIEGIKPGAIHKLREDQEDLFANALDSFSRQIWRKPRSRKPFRYDLAILHDPGEAFPPSDAKALKNFVRVGRSLGIDVDLIERKDYSRIAEYDALFIRETTNVADHTYRFAKKAESEGLVVMDDPVSILRCTNKVYLADLLRSHKLGMPATEILYKENPQELEKVGERLGFPLVLKIPDGSFSRGVIKVEDQEQLLAASAELFERSVLILAQEFFYTEYDWRIGVLNRKPIFACQYFMSKGHWQIYDHSPDAEEVSGDFRTMPVHEAPRKVVELAVKTANLIGDGLYGVDLKQAGDKVVVIEVNDNPNIDCGVEDVYLGDDLYKLVLEEFVRRLEVKRRGYD